ncbi:3-methylcrotonyl-CoA carboxylase subunit alpha [Sphingobium sp. TA15]|uniref:Methylcrotonyl-CoA carboxylase alpha subunit n=1 Tax=Sphingobium indicum (strain DSM 16413 / CCM 7287 / MTCC 6362 / UT26 / NBRC 101211 / UT26S) TaxID=452662 RepID=D4Z3N8_SPHIU|nr:acetyl/propionyl/methylcrotonyl-CoA carboxylase subunit alpha [Sphingobium indicum]BAI97220.1 methylcrotonyl-CoA carboxylase alpha subunit [Sphingobium indicum UT26S]BDD66641.1 3-methylcrotonyl-CoA carboxylase subunit alpha [Sphingobium sp. TA15]
MIQSLLIANRGEIACRIIRTARRLGIRTVAVYSDADARALHVREADEAVHIGPSPARESYLIGDRIIAAAKATGAQAIHPGYGFLSENAAFAQAVIDAGLIWVGPNPASITAMGLKDAAKKLMSEAGVPVTPGYLGEDQSAERLQSEADAIGYPVLIKAVAGGGGKGMRRVDAPEAFADALLSCQREAASSFGNDQVLIEKYILSPRHIEVQVFGDSHGQVVHLFERDCSLQRRHQKVIEEAPAPGMDAATREAICGAAVRAAQAVDYVGAGTVEFIADASAKEGGGLRADRIWFMEMNTRLQVEHPVTEEITGVDLVEWQLRVASGEPLPKKQEQLSINGHAIEARLYAEDPAKGFLPSPGRIDRLLFDSGARVETGVEAGDTVSSFYDPMIAKVICRGPDREAARTDLLRWLDGSFVGPLHTNKPFLHACLSMADFAEGRLDTGLIERQGEALTAVDCPSDRVLAAAGQRFRKDWTGREDREGLFGFRLNAAPKTHVDLFVDGRHVVADAASGDLRTDLRSAMERDGTIIVTQAGQSWFFSQTPPVKAGGAAASDGAILSPMPGRIIAVAVAKGDRVAKGQKLVTLEAMKMEHSLTAPFDGVVAELDATEGGQVSEGTLLVLVERGED